MGQAITLLNTTVITTNDTGTGQTAIGDLGLFNVATLLLTVSAKSLAGGGTLNLYVQGSPDGGTTWDDIVSFTQITNAAVANGTYVAFLNARQGANAVDRATALGTLTANTTKQNDWGDRMRVYTKAASFGVNDTVTIKVQAYLK